MAEGFAAGLAGGLQTGVGLAQTQLARQIQAEREQAYEQNVQNLEQAREATAAHQAAADQRQAQLDEAKQLQGQIADLRSRAQNYTDQNQIADAGQQINFYEQRLHDLFMRSPHAQMGQQAQSNAVQTASKLVSGTPLSDIPAQDVHDAFSMAFGKPINDVVSDPAFASALQDIHQGIANGHLDGGARAMQGINGVYGHTLDGHIGTSLPDGTPITSAKFVAPATNGTHIVPMAQYSGTTPDGRIASTVAPVMHPQATRDNGMPVAATTLGTVINHANALTALHGMAQHPDVAPILAKGAKGSNVQQAIDANAVSNAHPAFVAPGLAPDPLSDIPKALAPEATELYARAKALHDQGLAGTVQRYTDTQGHVIGLDFSTAPNAPKYLKTGINPDQSALDATKINLQKAQTHAAVQSAASSHAAEARAAHGGVAEWKGPDGHTFFAYKDGTDFTGKPIPQGSEPFSKSSTPQLGQRAMNYYQRVDSAVHQVAANVDTITHLPFGQTTGLMSGHDPGQSWYDISSAALKRGMSSGFTQQYNTLMTGFGRAVSTIEAAGLAPRGSISDQIQNAISAHPGDTYATKLYKLAQIKQDVISAAEPYLNYPGLSDAQKQSLSGALAKINQSIPFTTNDVLDFETQGAGKTFGQFIGHDKGAFAQGSTNASEKRSGSAKQAIPLTNSKGWKLMTDAHGNQAYVSPDGKQYTEVGK